MRIWKSKDEEINDIARIGIPEASPSGCSQLREVTKPEGCNDDDNYEDRSPGTTLANTSWTLQEGFVNTNVLTPHLST